MSWKLLEESSDSSFQENVRFGALRERSCYERVRKVGKNQDWRKCNIKVGFSITVVLRISRQKRKTTERKKTGKRQESQEITNTNVLRPLSLVGSSFMFLFLFYLLVLNYCCWSVESFRDMVWYTRTVDRGLLPDLVTAILTNPMASLCRTAPFPLLSQFVPTFVKQSRTRIKELTAKLRAMPPALATTTSGATPSQW